MENFKLALSPYPPIGNQDLADLYVQLFSLVQQLNKGRLILQSPNGHYWRIDVSDGGVLSTTDLGTSLP